MAISIANIATNNSAWRNIVFSKLVPKQLSKRLSYIQKFLHMIQDQDNH